MRAVLQPDGSYSVNPLSLINEVQEGGSLLRFSGARINAVGLLSAIISGAEANARGLNGGMAVFVVVDESDSRAAVACEVEEGFYKVVSSLDAGRRLRIHGDILRALSASTVYLLCDSAEVWDDGRWSPL